MDATKPTERIPRPPTEIPIAFDWFRAVWRCSGKSSDVEAVVLFIVIETPKPVMNAAIIVSWTMGAITKHVRPNENMESPSQTVFLRPRA